MKSTTQIIAESIIKQIDENQCLPWRKSWTGMEPRNPFSGTEYRGINYWLLPAGNYATYNQLKKWGGFVKAGTHGWPVIFASKFNPKDKNGNPKLNAEGKPIFAMNLKRFTVFSEDTWDISGADEKIYRLLNLDKKSSDKPKPGPEMAEKILAIPHGKFIDKPCYSPSEDKIGMPTRENFDNTDNFLHTYFHEFGHWTGHAKRLDRIKGSRYGSDPYAKEELIAELCAATVSRITGVSGDKLPDGTASYIKGWRDAIAKDNNLILDASGSAQKASNLLFSLAGITIPGQVEQAA